MPYDVPLVLSVVISFLSVLGLLSAVMDRHSPTRHALSLLVAGGMFYYAWYVSDGQISAASVPEAFLRIVAKVS